MNEAVTLQVKPSCRSGNEIGEATAVLLFEDTRSAKTRKSSGRGTWRRNIKESRKTPLTFGFRCQLPLTELKFAAALNNFRIAYHPFRTFGVGYVKAYAFSG